MWSKCEYEIILSPWTGRADDIKIDIYDQIMMNWNSFVDYVWSLKEIKKEQNKMSKSISKEMLYEEFFDGFMNQQNTQVTVKASNILALLMDYVV